jgi:Tfp pilus assembly protein PilO
MSGLQKMRQRFIIIVAVLAVLNLGLIVYLRWPGTSNSMRQAEQQNLEQELAQARRAAAPLHGIDKKLLDDREQVKNLYKGAIPKRWSEISDEIQKLAQDTGIVAQNIKYETKNSGLPDLQRINVQTSISGDYSKLARFINALERDKRLFLITQVSLSGQESGTVQLQIKFDTFLKETA